MIKQIFDIISNARPVILYGAGNNAKRQIEDLKRYFHIVWIWDRNATERTFCDIPVVKPYTTQEIEATDLNVDDAIVLITILNDQVRNVVAKELEKRGYENAFFSDKVLQLIREVENQSGENCGGIEKSSVWFSGDALKYTYISDKYPPVNYSVIASFSDGISMAEPSNEIHDELFRLLDEKLILDGTRTRARLKTFLSDIGDDTKSFLYAYEMFLRELLLGSVKTKERPIRMTGDAPYDPFAVFETQRQTIRALCGKDVSKCVGLTERLLRASWEKRYLQAVYCFFLTECGMPDKALQIAREQVKKRPVDFFENEMFYQIATIYARLGKKVEEPLPDTDLTKRFCWSGMNYIWCGGKGDDDKPLFAPCFRAIECAARPRGNFANGVEWELFRESLLDGSFRYCQKNQCANIVGDWLPRKERCKHPAIKKRIKGETVALIVEEIHLSYDRHCNLQCPSCRTSRVTYAPEKNRELDLFYERYLRGIVNNARHLCLSGSGEALLSPHSLGILRNLDDAASKDLKIELRTNMTALNERVWESLGSARRRIKHVVASIDACTPKLFERLRYPAKWENVLNNLAFARNLRERGEIEMFEFHVVIQSENIDELVGIAKMAIDYRADAVTYSKLINWRGMSVREYEIVNPFWIDHPKHKDLLKTVDKLKDMRNEIQRKGGEKPFYINIHFEKDPDDSYEPIRYGELKIR